MFPSVMQTREDVEAVYGEIQEHRRAVRLQLRKPSLDYITVSGTEVEKFRYIIYLFGDKFFTFCVDCPHSLAFDRVTTVVFGGQMSSKHIQKYTVQMIIMVKL